jgi:hypothetical protein
MRDPTQTEGLVLSMRRLFLVVFLACATASAQNADITAAQLLSGEADAQLQRLAREAAGNGRKLVISAPEYWHDLILEQLRRGGGDALAVEVRDSFAESVLVRSEDGSAAAAAAEAAPAVAEVATPATPAPQPPPPRTVDPAPSTPTVASQPPVPAPRPAAAQATTPPAAIAQPAPPRTPPPAAAQTRAPTLANAASPRNSVPSVPPGAPVATPAPVPVPVARTPVPAPSTPPPAPAPQAPPPAAASTAPPANTAAVEIASIKQRLERNLNGGDRVERSITQVQLEPGDVIYVRGPVKAVQRRQSLRSQLFWLEGDIELLRVELRELNPNRYQVMERIRSADNVRLRAVRTEERDLFMADDPDRHAEERSQLERRYNAGNSISATLAPEGLRKNDVLYLGDDLAVVVRINGLVLERYWMVGRINLGRSELLKDGNNKYKLLADVRQ